jgi:hypothetical protein
MGDFGWTGRIPGGRKAYTKDVDLCTKGTEYAQTIVKLMEVWYL